MSSIPVQIDPIAKSYVTFGCINAVVNDSKFMERFDKLLVK